MLAAHLTDSQSMMAAQLTDIQSIMAAQSSDNQSIMAAQLSDNQSIMSAQLSDNQSIIAAWVSESESSSSTPSPPPSGLFVLGQEAEEASAECGEPGRQPGDQVYSQFTSGDYSLFFIHSENSAK
jgi:hypothetical protein